MGNHGNQKTKPHHSFAAGVLCAAQAENKCGKKADRFETWGLRPSGCSFAGPVRDGLWSPSAPAEVGRVQPLGFDWRRNSVIFGGLGASSYTSLQTPSGFSSSDPKLSRRVHGCGLRKSPLLHPTTPESVLSGDRTLIRLQCTLRPTGLI